MTNLMIEQIGRRASLEHNGDWSKAASEYFRDHPEWQRDHDDTTELEKRVRDVVNAEVRSRVEMVASRDKLDLNKPADVVAAHAKSSPRIPICLIATEPQTRSTSARFR